MSKFADDLYAEMDLLTIKYIEHLKDKPSKREKDPHLTLGQIIMITDTAIGIDKNTIDDLPSFIRLEMEAKFREVMARHGR